MEQGEKMCSFSTAHRERAGWSEWKMEAIVDKDGGRLLGGICENGKLHFVAKQSEQVIFPPSANSNKIQSDNSVSISDRISYKSNHPPKASPTKDAQQ